MALVEKDDLMDEIHFFPRKKQRQRLVRIPLAFKDPEIEKAFCIAQAVELNKALRKGLGAIFVFMLFAYVQELLGYWDLWNLPASDMLMVGANTVGLMALLVMIMMPGAGEKTAMLAMPFLVIIVMISHRYRSVYLTGDDISIPLGRQHSSELFSDSVTMVTLCCGIEGFYVTFCVRCRWSIVQLILLPAIYSAFTLPLPDDVLEGGMQRKVTLTLRILLACLLGFIGRVIIETQARVEFLRVTHLARDLTRERVLRATAEYQRENEAFSGRDARVREKDCGASEADSRAVSSIVFEQADPSKQQLHLQAMQALGVDEGWAVSSPELRIFPRERLGAGGFGVVMRGRCRCMDVAIKVTQTQEVAWSTLAAELRILRKLRHPRVVAFHGACIFPSARELILVEELIEGPSLDVAVSLEISKASRHRVIMDVCEALQYLHGHEPAIVHGDIKPGNIMLQGELQGPIVRAKLIDFGMAISLKRDSRGKGGSALYIAPETLLKVPGSLTPGADIFSIGRLLFFVATGLKPLRSISFKSLFEMTRDGIVPSLDWPTLSSQTNEEPVIPYKELAEACTVFEPSLRPSSDDVLRQLEMIALALDSSGTHGEREAEDALMEVLMEIRKAESNSCATSAVSHPSRPISL